MNVTIEVDYYKMTSIFSIDPAIPNELVSSQYLYSLHMSGFKPVALSEGHMPEEWTPIYDNPHYWKDKSFNDPKIYARFKNVATTLGKTHVKDSENRDLYLQVLDVDSEHAFNLISTPISELCENNSELESWMERFFNSSDMLMKEYWNFTLLDLLKQITFVTKTRKPFGYHFWWLSRSQNRSIRTTHCQKAKEFEIKTDKSSALCTLPPSTHRDDPTFRYSFVGRIDEMLINDFLYDLFVCMLKDCLRTIGELVESKVKEQDNQPNLSPNNRQQQNYIFHDLSDLTIQKTTDLLCPYYVKGERHNFSLHFSGLAYHCNISEEAASKMMLEICKQKQDKDFRERLVTLQTTYQKGSTGQVITGGPTLADLMSKVKNCSVNEAQKILDDIKDLWYKESHHNNDYNTGSDDKKENSHSNKIPILSVSQVKMNHHGRYKVRGKIMQCGASFKMISGANSSCLNPECEYEFQKKFPRPLILAIDREISDPCPKCSKSQVSITFDFINAIELELQDVNDVNDVDRLLVYLFEDNTRSIKIGETVVIEGNIAVINKNDNRRKKLIAALYGNTITYENEVKIELTQADIDKITHLKEEKEGVEEKDTEIWIDFLVSHLAPQIARNYYTKLGLLLAAVNSGPDEIFRKRDRIHVLLVGEPGLAKTKLLEDVVELVPNSKYMSMSNTSGISLTAMIEKDENGGGYSVRAGSIVLAKNAIFAANEIGDLDFRNQLYLGDIMEEGVTHISKYTIDAQLVAPVTMIAACNPTHTYWKHSDRIEQTEIPLPPKEIDRYDLKFFMRMPREKEQLYSFASEMVECDNEYPLPVDYTFLKKVIHYSKQFKPKLSDQAITEIQNYWIEVACQTGSVRIKRVLERLSKAIAKLHFRNVVSLEDALKAIQIYKYMMSQYDTIGYSNTIPKNPQYVAADVCVDILKENPAVDKRMDELIQLACSKSLQVAAYFSGEKRIRTSYKARSVRDVLLQHPNIRRVGINPVILQWLETEQQQSEKRGLSSFLPTSETFNGNLTSSKIPDEKDQSDRRRNTVEENKPKDTAHIVEDDEGDECNVCNVDKMKQNIADNLRNCNKKEGPSKTTAIKSSIIQTTPKNMDNKEEPKGKKYPTDQTALLTTTNNTTTLHSSHSLHSSPSQTATSPDNLVGDNNTKTNNKKIELRYTKESDIQTNDSLETEFVKQNEEVI